MKRDIIYTLAVIAIMLYGCKPSEANYRSAYSAAKQKQEQTADSLSLLLQQQNMPKPYSRDGVTVPMRTEAIGYTKDGGADADHSLVRRYCVAVAQFKQVFNARSMAGRLREHGYDEAVVIHNRQKEYYVIAGSSNSIAEAADILHRVGEDSSVVRIKPPFPYVLRPAHLAR